MDFTTIGKIGSFVKQRNLMFAANYKIKTGNSITDANGNLNFSKSSMFEQVAAAQQKKLTEVDKARLSSIRQKLMSGKKLSNTEMAYLRDKDEKLYKKAKHAEDAREELKSELSKAKTKQEARQAVTRAMVKASAEASAEIAAYKASMNIGGGGGAGIGDVNVGDLPNVDTADNPTTLETNTNISTGEFTENANVNTNETSNLDNTNTDNANADNTSNNQSSPLDKDDNDGQFGLPDIIEKFIMTIRALEDEWAQFTKTDKYKDLPEFESEETEFDKIIDAPDSKSTAAIMAYRKAMMYRSAL